MAKDLNGNELEIGDYVEVHLNNPRIFGRVVSVEQGGTVIASMRRGQEERVTAGKVTVTAVIDIPVDPRNPLTTTVKCAEHDPDERAKVRREAGLEEGATNGSKILH